MEASLLNSTSSPRPLPEIERSLIKRYRKQIWSKFIKAIQEYRLVEKGDKIAVCISGGKDSMLMAKLFQELQRHGKFDFSLEFIAMDPGYAPEYRQLMEKNLTYLNVPHTVFDSDIFSVTDEVAQDYPCYLCARMRRGFLYARAQELGCNKISLGHHFNDVIETTMMNVLYSGNFKTMVPKLRSENFENLHLIRPLYLIEEEYIIRWMTYTGLKPLDCACSVAAKKISSSREEVKELIAGLKEHIPNVDISIFRSAQNINLDMILGYEQRGQKKSFNDIYEDYPSINN